MSPPDPPRPPVFLPDVARVHQGQRAGFVSRSIAALLDLAFVACLLAVAYAGWCVARFVVHPRTFAFPAPSTTVQVTSYLVVSVAYLTVAWCTTGRSPGQEVLGLRVTDRDGHRPGMVAALLRAALCVGFPLGLLGVLFSSRRRALHDVVVRTTVTYDWPSLRS